MLLLQYETNMVSCSTELVDMSMLDHVLEANFCCEAAAARANSLLRTYIEHSQCFIAQQPYFHRYQTIHSIQYIS